MRNVYVVALHELVFLPYLHGLLRCAVGDDAELAAEYAFGDPVFLSRPIDEIAASLRSPDVVGFSCYVWNVRRHMALAERVRRLHPGCLIVAGGPQVPRRAERFLEEYPCVDLAVAGEGEPAFLEILRRRLRRQPDWSGIEGVAFRRDGASVAAPAPAEGRPRERRVPAAGPYGRGFLDSAIQECRRRHLRFYALWETNRGCPYSCTFCDWGSATMSLVRAFPPPALEADVECFARQQVDAVFICDANFGLLPRDLDIARRLVAARGRSGYPRQVRVNFAKESNDRVFEISRVFAASGLSMGTTLSMQSLDPAVLDAVERRNMKFESYEALSRRYRAAGIATYSELVLGLPNETREGFEEGIGTLLEGGNHDDIRVFDFMLLPNSPVNNAESIRRYGLRAVRRRLYLDDAVEVNEEAEFVVASNSLPAEDWARCSVFAQAVQALHNGCYTRYLAIHLRRSFGLGYAEFYRRLVTWALAAPGTVLGSVLGPLHRLYLRYVEDDGIPAVHQVASQPAMMSRVAMYGTRRGWRPDQWAWLCVAAERARFYRELADEFLPSLRVPRSEALQELLRFQSDVMLDAAYDPRRGKRARYAFDFPSFVLGERPLRRRAVEVHFRDAGAGVDGQFPLEPGNLRAFANAAVGKSYPFLRIRHYQHQLADAIVRYDGPDALPAAELAIRERVR